MSHIGFRFCHSSNLSERCRIRNHETYYKVAYSDEFGLYDLCTNMPLHKTNSFYVNRVSVSMTEKLEAMRIQVFNFHVRNRRDVKFKCLYFYGFVLSVRI